MVGTERNNYTIPRDDPKTPEWFSNVGIYTVGFIPETIREHIYDRAVGKMIESGVKHIEFIAVNNLTRSAFKKYFKSLVIREHGYAQERKRIEKESNEEDAQSISQQTISQIEED